MKDYLYINFLFALLLLNGCSPEDKSSRAKGETPAQTETSRAAEADEENPVILFFGNSLTAGYGLQPEQSFPSLIQERLDSLGYPHRVVNAGVSGETTSGGLGRIDWVLSQPIDVFILELGGNDGLRGIDPAQSRKNLQAIIDKVQESHPEAEIILAGMEAPPNMGPEFTSEFRRMYPGLAEANDITLIPFLLEGVGGEPDLNQPDGIHPNAEGARRVADNVWKVLEGVLDKNPSES